MTPPAFSSPRDAAPGVCILGVRVTTVPARGHGAELEPIAVIVGVALVALLAVLPLPLIAPFFGECTFHTLSGYPCPTCGVTRGMLALGEGDVLGALRFNPLVFGVLALCALYLPVAFVLWIAKRPRPRLAFASARARAAWWMAFGLAVALNWAFLIVDGR